MITVALIAFGGGVGAGLRWTAFELVRPDHRGFPTVITVVNVVGSLALGIIVGYDSVAPFGWQVGPLTVGVLAGFTTFSTWMVDIDLAPHLRLAALIALIPLAAGLVAAAIGIAIGTAIA